MPRDAFPAHQGTSGGDAEGRESAGAEMRGSAAAPAFEANDPPDRDMNVPQVAGYLRISKTSARKLVERQEIPAIKIRGLLRVGKDELDETLCAMGNDI